VSRSVAINVGANTSLPGFRGPVRPDGSFAYVPIPEREPTAESVPTYGDLAPHLDADVPSEHRDTPVHLDPAFAEYPRCDGYAYGDEHGVKARPLSALSPGDSLLFYATLEVTAPAPWLPPSWGAFLVGEFRVERAVTGEEYAGLPADERAAFADNAHLKRADPAPEVLVVGDERSRLLDRAVPLSAPSGGTDANGVVRSLSGDSGKGPWWRRPLRFGADATERLRALVEAGQREPGQPDV
jgi:hypothetical protein